MKTLHFDCETTGIDRNRDQIIQFAALVEVDGKIIDKINLKARPDNEELLNDKVLDILNLTYDEVLSWGTQLDMYLGIIEFFDKHINKYDKSDKFIPCGYNVQFDIDMLASMFRRHGNHFLYSYLDFFKIDVMAICQVIVLLGGLEPEDMKLGSVCDAAGIQLGGNAHNALYDIVATKKLLDWCLERLSLS